MGTTTKTQPKWGTKHDAIVSRYEQRVRERSIKEVVVIPGN